MLKATTLCRLSALLAVLAMPALAHAQDPPRLRVSFGGAATSGAIDSEPALFASVGYRFAEHLAFDIEVTGIDEAADRFRDAQFMGRDAVPAGTVRVGSIIGDNRQGMFGPLPSGGGFGQVTFGGGIGQIQPIGVQFSSNSLRVERDGRTALATVGFRYEIASQVTRFMPYVSAGVGMSRTEESLRVDVLAMPVLPARPGTPTVIRPPVGIHETVTHNGLAASAGVGASVRIVGQLSLDVDARYFRLDRDRNLGRFGGGVSYRF